MYNSSSSLSAVYLVTFENASGLEPTCSQCPPPSTCIGEERCMCAPTHVRVGRFGCEQTPTDKPQSTSSPTATGPNPDVNQTSSSIISPARNDSCSCESNSTSNRTACRCSAPNDSSTTIAVQVQHTDDPALVGGIVGGLVLLVIVVVVVVYALKRGERSRRTTADLTAIPAFPSPTQGNYGVVPSSSHYSGRPLQLVQGGTYGQLTTAEASRRTPYDTLAPHEV